MNSAVEQTTINHFHEKLLKLRGMMKTRVGGGFGCLPTASCRSQLIHCLKASQLKHAMPAV